MLYNVFEVLSGVLFESVIPLFVATKPSADVVASDVTPVIVVVPLTSRELKVPYTDESP